MKFTVWSIIFSLFIALLLGVEYFSISQIPEWSLLFFLQRTFPQYFLFEISLEPGGALGFTLGIIGTCLMAVTYIHSLRKRFSIFRKLGDLIHWLKVHVICGILGPVFIIFHSNFKTGGVAGLALWTMIIVVISGVLGLIVHFSLSDKEFELEKTGRKIKRKSDIEGEVIKGFNRSRSRLLVVRILANYWDTIHIPISALLFFLIIIHVTSSLVFWLGVR